MFLTLTYADENLPENNQLSKRDCQLFLKRLRKKQSKHTTQKVRYYLCGEYGEETNRPHYHALIFNVKKSIWLEIDDLWKLGQIKIGTCTEASIHYTTKYMIQSNLVSKEWVRPFALMSRKPPIGISYLTDNMTNYIRKIDRNNVIKEGGIKQPLPKIYKQKTLSKLDRLVEGRKQLQLKIDEENKLMEKAKKKKIDYYKRIHDNTVGKHNQMINSSKSKTI